MPAPVPARPPGRASLSWRKLLSRRRHGGAGRPRGLERPPFGGAPARYGLAAALAALSFSVENAFAAFFAAAHFVLFYPTSFLTAWLAGLGPALLHLALAVAGVFWIFHGRPPTPLPSPALTALRVAIFCAVNLVGIWVLTRGRRALEALRDSEEALRRRDEDLRRAQAVAGIGSWHLDLLRDELTWSEEEYRIFGVPPGTPMSYPRFLDIVHPEDRAMLDAAWSGAQRGEPYDIEHRIVAQGRVKWVHEKAEVFFDAAGRAVKGIGTTQDVTERRRASEELRQARERFELALRGADLGTWDWNVRTGEVVFNARWAGMRGYRLEEVEPRVSSWEANVHPDDLPLVRRALEEHFAGRRKEYEAEHRVRTKSGDWIWVLDRGRVFARDEQGRPLRMVGTELDVTARKRAEEQLRRLGEQERFRAALEAAAAATVVVGRDGRIAFVNSAAESLFGWTRAEMVGQLVEMLIPERFRARHAGYRDAFFREPGARRPMGAGRDLVALRKDRTELPIEAGLARGSGSVSEFPAEVGLTRVSAGEEYVVVTLADVSVRKAAEESLRASVAELERFAYTISHDLRAPLRAIEGYAHLLSERLGPQTDEQGRAMLGRVREAAARLDRLIRDLLSYAAVSRAACELEPVDLDAALAHVVAHYPDVGRARLRVRAPLGRASAQPSLLTQALANLLGNAVKFVPEGREPEVEVWAEREGGTLRLNVRDNGIGIPPEHREKVFEPFTRLRPEYEGTGMGLSIVKRAMERMGGRVRVESEPGRGSRFWLELRDA